MGKQFAMRRIASVLPIVALQAWSYAHAVEPTQTAIEYYNPATRHHFMTASPHEARLHDGGSAEPGWARTGGQFRVFATIAAATGLVPVSRFYSRVLNPHLYTANADTCELVHHNS